MSQEIIDTPGVAARPVAKAPSPEEDRSKRIEGRSPWILAWERLRRDRVAMVSLAVIILIILMAIFAPVTAWITGHGVTEQDRTLGLDPNGEPQGPSSHFWMGADENGRDILVRIAYGARISLITGVIATGMAIVIGVIVGISAGYFGRMIDTVLARLIDIMLAFPFLMFAIALASRFGPSLKLTIIVIGLFSWASVARIVRGQVLSIREKEYVEAARSLGAGDARIMFVDIFPNVLAPVIVYATLLVPTVIVFEASLSYLGLGIGEPTADWGAMLNGASQGGLYQVAWWYVVFPGLALLVTTLAFNLFGDGVRDAFDPRGERLLQS